MCAYKGRENINLPSHKAPIFQKLFLCKFSSLKCEFEKLGNLLGDTYVDKLLQFFSRDVMSATNIETIRGIETNGVEQCQEFIT